MTFLGNLVAPFETRSPQLPLPTRNVTVRRFFRRKNVRRILIATLLAAAAPMVVLAQDSQAPAAPSSPVPKEQLLQPPANAVHYVVVSEAGKHGDQWRWQ